MTIGIMDVTLVGARGLKSTDFLGKIDPYVSIQYKNQEQKSHTAPGQGTAPVWNEKFRFKIEFPKKGKIEQPKLVLTIMDRDTFTRDDFLGQTTIYLKELFEVGMEEGKAELSTQTYRVVAANQTYRGELMLESLLLHRKELIMGKSMVDGRKAHFSLCYYKFHLFKFQSGL